MDKDNKIDWKTELDPRKYCFGHSLYRRLVSTVTSYRLRIRDDEKNKEDKLAETDITMSLLSDSMFAGRGGHVEVFEFALDQEVIVRQEDGYAEHIRCKVTAQLMMNVESPDRSVCECYMTDKHGDVWQAPEMMTGIMDEEDQIVKDVNETNSSKV